MNAQGLTRRALLKSAAFGAAATSVPLPWMRTAFAQATAPKRVVIVFVGNGAPEEGFFPAGASSASAVFPFITEPLDAVRGQAQIVSGLHTYMPNSNTTTGGHGDPYRMFNIGRFGELHDTFDTALGRLWSNETPFENLLLGTMMDSGPSYALTTRAGATLYYERSPVRAFESMFEAGTVVDTTDYDRKKRIIDIARQQVRRFRTQLGTLERDKLDEHVDAIDRVDNLIRPPEGTQDFCTAPPFNAGGFNGDVANSTNFDTIASLHIELIGLAFRCDMTRVVTFGLCGDQGEPSIPNVLQQGYHGGSVHSDRGRYATYRRYFTSKLVELMNRLAATPDVDGGNVLDNTIILFTSNMGDGSTHGNIREFLNIPTILAGGQNLGNKVGHYTNLGYDADDPTRFLGDPGSRQFVQGNLLDTVATMLGVDIEAPSWPRYGGNLAPISQLLA